jgi:hypothetical protein
MGLGPSVANLFADDIVREPATEVEGKESLCDIGVVANGHAIQLYPRVHLAPRVVVRDADS